MPRSDEVAAVARVQTRHSFALRAHPNVMGTATGPQFTGGRLTGDIAVKVYVSRKVPGLPGPAAVPRFVGGVPTDVVECGTARALASTFVARHRPVQGGCSVGHPGAPGGTIAVVCADARTRKPLMLSNHHVLVMAAGSRLRNRILQPDVGDGGDPTVDVVGRLARAAFGRRVDAAVAHLEVPFEPTILGIGAVQGMAPAALHQRVRKSGRTTGVTAGRIVDVNADIVVEVRGRQRRFTGQLAVDIGADLGDSGSLLVATDRRAVGLIFAGTSAFALANPIQAVVRALRITI